MCGAVTGALFKSTLGFVPTMVGGVLGGTMIGALTKLVEEGNKRGVLAFEMRFWCYFRQFLNFEVLLSDPNFWVSHFQFMKDSNFELLILKRNYEGGPNQGIPKLINQMWVYSHEGQSKAEPQKEK